MSDEKAVEPKVFRFPQTNQEAYEMLTDYQVEEKKLGVRIKRLKEYLSLSIPQDSTDEDGKPVGIQDGIINCSYPRKTTSWAKVYDACLDRFVPKTQHANAKAMVEDEFTKYPIVLKFKAQEELSDADTY